MRKSQDLSVAKSIPYRLLNRVYLRMRIAPCNTWSQILRYLLFINSNVSIPRRSSVYIKKGLVCHWKRSCRWPESRMITTHTLSRQDRSDILTRKLSHLNITDTQVILRNWYHRRWYQKLKKTRKLIKLQ